MKITKLNITKFRGIIELELNFEGKNAVISGPNGVGKSAVVDAIDFLLRGDITRLKGEGTGEVTLSKHGPHVGYEASDAKVSAEIQSLNGKTFRVSRTITNSNEPNVDDGYETEFKNMVEYAKSGAHFLSRREILKYIWTRPSTRSEQIQTLLNIRDLKEKRDVFNKLKNRKKKELQEIKKEHLDKLDKFRKTLSVSDDGEILNVVNDFRAKLGGKRVDVLDEECFTCNLSYADSKESENISSVIRDLEQLSGCIIQYEKKINLKINELDDVIKKIRSEKYIDVNIKSIELIKNGLKLLDGSGKCPLCLIEWPSEEELEQFLNVRRNENDELVKLSEEFDDIYSTLLSIFLEFDDKLSKSISSLTDLKDDFKDKLTQEHEKITTLMDSLKKSAGEFVDDKNEIDSYIINFSGSDLKTTIDDVKQKYVPYVDKQSKIKSDAWSALCNAQMYYTKLKKLNEDIHICDELYRKSELLLTIYDESQQSILNELYSSISESFSEYYKIMHGVDEAGFIAKLENVKAGVNMNVDFFGKGMYPPMAFHSEGHQDSMGIGLYFALMNKLTTSEFGLVVLDDVVMSVDIEHRRNFCKLLNTHFANRQLIITTHDDVWAKNLIIEGVVDKSKHIYFNSWSVEEGPIIIYGKNIWQIARGKANVDLHGASAFLRREMEAFFESICDSIKANIPYNSSHKWDYGQYMNASHSQLKIILEKAKKHADRYKDVYQASEIDKLQKLLKENRKLLDSNSWVTNSLVHYNPTNRIAKAEFIEAVNALENFCSLFECSNCNTILKLAYENSSPTVLKCKCGKFNYLLK